MCNKNDYFSREVEFPVVKFGSSSMYTDISKFTINFSFLFLLARFSKIILIYSNCSLMLNQPL